MRIALAQLNFQIGAIDANCRKIEAALESAKQAQADVLVTSELALCGYPPRDLLLLPSFATDCKKALQSLVPKVQNMAAIIGFPRLQEPTGSKLFNSAAIIVDGAIIGFADKRLLPCYDVFDEPRYFQPGSKTCVCEIKGKRFGITICEDIWENGGLLPINLYRCNPLIELKTYHIDALINLSASPYSQGKSDKREWTCQQAAQTLHCPVFLCNQVGGYDSILFDGRSLAVQSGGAVQRGIAFGEEIMIADLQNPLFSPRENLPEGQELWEALAMGLKDYVCKTGFKKVCLGLSGGIDSAVCACLAAGALGPSQVIGIALPSLYSSPSSYEDAATLADRLGIAFSCIPIDPLFQHYLDILHPFFTPLPPDIAEENLQARIRSTLLMALANKHGYLLLSTSNKSEAAVGYTTLYGDMAGAISPIGDVLKTEVYMLARYINRLETIIPQSTIDKAPSAELRPNQKDSDTLPPYEILDKIVRGHVEEGMSAALLAEKTALALSDVEALIAGIHRAEYKRRQAPLALRVTEKAFMAGRDFPIAHGY